MAFCTCHVYLVMVAFCRLRVRVENVVKCVGYMQGLWNMDRRPRMYKYLNTVANVE